MAAANRHPYRCRSCQKRFHVFERQEIEEEEVQEQPSQAGKAQN